MRNNSRRRAGIRLAASAFVLGMVGLTTPAYAAEGSIDHVQDRDGRLTLLYSIPGGAAPDLGSVAVTFEDTKLEAVAERASTAEVKVRRTTVLAMDVSDSMAGDRIEAAKRAAGVFLDNAPDDLNVGLVTFAGAVARVAEPTTDHDALKATVASLELTRGTKLYQGVAEAVAATGAEGARSVLLLSDGGDSTDTPITAALEAITGAEKAGSKVKVDVVAIAQEAAAREKLTQIATAGGGSVLDADEPDQVEALFEGEASQLAQQVLITATPPETLLGKDGQVHVTINAGGEIYTDSTFVSLSKQPAAPRPVELVPADTAFSIDKSWMWMGLGAAALAVGTLIVVALGGFGRPERDIVAESIDAYTRSGARRLAQAQSAPSQTSVTQQAVGAAQNFLASNRGIEATLGQRIEAAGMQIKPAEWLLLHSGIAFGTGLILLLLSGGNVLFMLLGLGFGALGPWLFLGFKRSKRLKAFNAQLADTLQLMAGSLSAGLSLAQSADTVVREGTEPMAGEFRRALVEARLGVEIEEALAGIADRMGSKDFEWVVMAIRIQREVGGNLAELLNNVAETIREREYLERQVLTLSAEGRLSVWILGGLPPGFMAYLMMANPEYLKPLYTEVIGIVMLVVMLILEVAGVLWMKKLVKVDV